MSALWETVETAAREYVSLLLDTAANGWGQHVHPVYGQSHLVMRKIRETFGYSQTEAAIDAEFARRRAEKKKAGM